MTFELPVQAAVSVETTEILNGLRGFTPQIGSKYFYDAHGSMLFEQITRLPEYYPTRTERTIMVQHGPEIASHAGIIQTVIEPGAGNCEKAHMLCDLLQPAHFVGIDISADFVRDGVAALQQAFPELDARAVAADITSEIRLPEDLPRQQRLFFYPGSSIGNFSPEDAQKLVARMRRAMGADGALLIGVDLVKDTAVLEAAYDDAAGVTAAFNLNMLEHINRLVGTDFDLRQWRHVALFNQERSRIEMHLEATENLVVHWPDDGGGAFGGERAFRRGERIHTENSYKYRLGDFFQLLRRAGYSRTEAWTDARDWFAVILARP